MTKSKIARAKRLAAILTAMLAAYRRLSETVVGASSSRWIIPVHNTVETVCRRTSVVMSSSRQHGGRLAKKGLSSARSGGDSGAELGQAAVAHEKRTCPAHAVAAKPIRRLKNQLVPSPKHQDRKKKQTLAAGSSLSRLSRRHEVRKISNSSSKAQPFDNAPPIANSSVSVYRTRVMYKDTFTARAAPFEQILQKPDRCLARSRAYLKQKPTCGATGSRQDVIETIRLLFWLCFREPIDIGQSYDNLAQPAAPFEIQMQRSNTKTYLRHDPLEHARSRQPQS